MFNFAITIGFWNLLNNDWFLNLITSNKLFYVSVYVNISTVCWVWFQTIMITIVIGNFIEFLLSNSSQRVNWKECLTVQDTQYKESFINLNIVEFLLPGFYRKRLSRRNLDLLKIPNNKSLQFFPTVCHSGHRKITHCFIAKLSLLLLLESITSYWL